MTLHDSLSDFLRQSEYSMNTFTIIVMERYRYGLLVPVAIIKPMSRDRSGLGDRLIAQHT